MNKMILATALILAATLPFVTTSAFAETTNAPAALCAEAPAKAEKADVDCAATSAFERDRAAQSDKYPAGPVYFGNGVVF